MKKVTTIILIMFLFCGSITAQQKFIKASTSNDFGSRIKVFSTPDLGWIVFSMDSLKLSKFNSCGISEWSKKYNIPTTNSSLSDFIQTKSGDFVLLTRILNGIIYSACIARIDLQGNITWSKSYRDAVYTQFPYTISEDNQGNIFIFGNTEHTGNNSVFNLITKIDGSGNLLWTKFYDHGWVWGGTIVTSDNGLLIRTGSNFIKTDNAGNVQWQSQVLGLGYYYIAPVEVSDGYIFTGYTSGTQYITFGKIDKTGNLLWGGRKTSDLPGTPTALHKRNNGNIAGVFLKNGSTVVEFDKDLNVVKQNSINTAITLYGKDICFVKDTTPVLIGFTGSPSAFFIARMDKNYSTNCDVASSPVNITIDPLTQSFQPTNVTTYSLNVINENYSVDTFSLSMTTLCFVPKTLDLGSDTLICGHASLTLQNNTGDVFDSYLWSTGDTTPTIAINQSGTYWLLATYNCGENEVSDTVEATTVPVVTVDLGKDMLICIDSSEMLTAPVCSSCNYTWSTGSTLAEIEISKEGTYWLSIDNTNGCITGDTVEASIVKCDCNLYVPNAFTPNDDATNELFKPVFDCDFSDYNLRIFNRWGQLIYTTKNKEDGWNGKFNNVSVPQGIYLYAMSYNPVLKGELKNTITKTGTVAVIY
ncbi:MAG: gliding motility-associated C-terminal domain-containing protein [Bacteroidia bacterium]